MLVIGKDPTDHFKNIHEFRHIYGQRCNTKADVPDMCGRIAKVGSHVLALGIGLFCPWFKKILVKKLAVFDNRQATRIRPNQHFVRDGQGDHNQANNEESDHEDDNNMEVNEFWHTNLADPENCFHHRTGVQDVAKKMEGK